MIDTVDIILIVLVSISIILPMIDNPYWRMRIRQGKKVLRRRGKK